MTSLPPDALRRRLVAVAAVLLLTAAFTWLLRDMVRDVVVLPLTFLFWYLDLLLRSVPERVLLAVLVILGVFLALRSLTRRPPAPPPTGAPIEPRRGEDSRLRFWRVQFTYAPTSDFAAEKLAAELRSLLLQTIEHRERRSRDEILHAAAEAHTAADQPSSKTSHHFTLDLPPAVRAVLLDQKTPAPPAESLLRKLQRLLHLPLPPQPPTTYERDLTTIVEFLEHAETP